MEIEVEVDANSRWQKPPCWAVTSQQQEPVLSWRHCPGRAWHTHPEGYPEHPSPQCHCKPQLTLHLTCPGFAGGLGRNAEPWCVVILKLACWCRMHYTATQARWPMLPLGQQEPQPSREPTCASLVTLAGDQPEPWWEFWYQRLASGCNVPAANEAANGREREKKPLTKGILITEELRPSPRMWYQVPAMTEPENVFHIPGRTP